MRESRLLTPSDRGPRVHATYNGKPQCMNFGLKKVNGFKIIFSQMDVPAGPEGVGLAAGVLPLADSRHLRRLRHRAVTRFEGHKCHEQNS